MLGGGYLWDGPWREVIAATAGLASRASSTTIAWYSEEHGLVAMETQMTMVGEVTSGFVVVMGSTVAVW